MKARIIFTLILFTLAAHMTLHGAPSEKTNSWSCVDKKGDVVEYTWVESGQLENERTVFVNAFTQIYQEFSLDTLKIKSLPEFLNAAFDDEVIDLNSDQMQVYTLNAKIDGTVVGFAAFNQSGITDQIYIRQTAVDPAFWRRGIATKMLFSIFKKFPATKHLVLVTRRINACARSFYTSLGFTECMYTHEGYNPERYVGFEYSVPSNYCFDEKTISLREIPYSNKKINWQKPNK